MKKFFLSLFLRTADDLISFLDHVEAKLRTLADAAKAEADEMEHDAIVLRAKGEAAAQIADRIKG
jgi:hypothetical protein